MPKDLPTEHQVADAIRTAREEGATVEIVGSWPWADFEEKPDEATRAVMSAAGWRWSRKKRRWYLRTTESGVWRRSTYADLCARHGVTEIEDEQRPAPATEPTASALF